ncbi:hypothetical protein GOA77_31950, partial [Sinorhizobium meliloti]|nr:hypothetical protein [Sinorhizobium meliloti]
MTAGITIEREFGRAVVLADPRRMRQVLLTLLDNACRYAPGGTVAVQTFTAENRAGMRCLDTGPGMPLDAQVRAFDRFWRGDDSRARVSADSDEAAPLFRDDCAPGFRDDLAPCLVGSAGDD